MRLGESASLGEKEKSQLHTSTPDAESSGNTSHHRQPTTAVRQVVEVPNSDTGEETAAHIVKVGPGARGRWISGPKGKTSIQESKLTRNSSQEPKMTKAQSASALITARAEEAKQKMMKRQMSAKVVEERGAV